MKKLFLLSILITGLVFLSLSCQKANGLVENWAQPESGKIEQQFIETKSENPQTIQQEDASIKLDQILENYKVAYVVNKDLWIMRGDGSERKRLTNTKKVWAVKWWIKDGKYLIYQEAWPLSKEGYLKKKYRLYFLDNKHKHKRKKNYYLQIYLLFNILNL